MDATTAPEVVDQPKAAVVIPTHYAPRPWRPGWRADGDRAPGRGHRNFLCVRGDAFPMMAIVRPRAGT